MGFTNNVDVISITNNTSIPLTENILQDESILKKLRDKKFKKVINCFIDERVEELARTIGAITDINSDISR
jgi:hypothetical protein